MPNIATILKAEISRVARREVRPVLDAVKKTAAAQRAEISGLRKSLAELERQLKALQRAPRGQRVAQAPADSAAADASGLRFRAAGLASHRERLGLSARDFGRLVGVSGQAIHAWEARKAKPTANNLRAIAELRSLGKRAVAAKLADLAAE